MKPADSAAATFEGNDRILIGIILGVVAFWLFAQTTLNIAPDMRRDLGLSPSTMDIAVAITALFSGIFIVVFGGLADRFGRVLIVRVGFYLSIVGAILVGVAPSGNLAVPFLMSGRALQGLSAACIMSASLALVKTFWHGAARQRAISLWSIGSWGGSGLSAVFGGVMAQTVGWRWIFFACAALSLLGLLLMRGTPESRAASSGSYRFDTAGVITFLVSMLALQIVVTQGIQLGWTSLPTIALIVVAVVAGFLFLRIEKSSSSPFVDFSLFSSSVYTGATISNFLLNGVAGTLIVSLQLLQLGGEMTAQQAGMLTLGYAITIISSSGWARSCCSASARASRCSGAATSPACPSCSCRPQTCCWRITGRWRSSATACSAWAWPFMPRRRRMRHCPACRRTRPVRGQASTRWPHRWVRRSAWRSRRRSSPRSAIPMRAVGRQG